MIKRSTINFWKMQGEGAWGIQRVLNMIHGYVYYTLYDHYIACAIFVARTLSRFPKIFFKTVIIDFFGTRYHCKVITYESARKLIAVEEDIVLPTEESKKIIPWKIANKIILKHKEQLAIVDCPCRMEKKTAGKKYCEPMNTCIFYGKTGVDFVTSHMPRMNGHRATKEEVLNLLELQQKNGKVLNSSSWVSLKLYPEPAVRNMKIKIILRTKCARLLNIAGSSPKRFSISVPSPFSY